MKKKLLIVFVKNKKLGHVKTRLAKTIGDQAALEIYEELLTITQNEISKLDFDKAVYFSEHVENEDWLHFEKRIQLGSDLGAKMQNAFLDGFNKNYDAIVLIGSDLPDISATIITNAFAELNKKNVVFGPAEDGGYYLIGLSQMLENVFTNKPWSQPQLLSATLGELRDNSVPFSLLETLNDIDDYDDLEKSDFYKTTSLYQKKKLRNEN